MPLPDSYTLKPDGTPAYFDAILSAQPPERFSLKFLENLGFTATNDRLFIGILKDLGFLNRDGAPQQRYFDFLDRKRAKHVLAEGIREAYSDLFAINTQANALPFDDVKNKLRTLYAGKKTDLIIGRIAKTFTSLCAYADWSEAGQPTPPSSPDSGSEKPPTKPGDPPADIKHEKPGHGLGSIRVAGLQYHINIVLPDTRDQAVYDAIFRSLREHLG